MLPALTNSEEVLLTRDFLQSYENVGDDTNSDSQNIEPFFEDPNNEYFNKFDRMLSGVTAKNSETTLCIDQYLKKSEKEWFSKRHDAKLGKYGKSRAGVHSITSGSGTSSDGSRRGSDSEAGLAQFALGDNFVPIKGLKKFMLLKLFDWPVYAFFLAFVSCPSL